MNRALSEFRKIRFFFLPLVLAAGLLVSSCGQSGQGTAGGSDPAGQAGPEASVSSRSETGNDAEPDPEQMLHFVLYRECAPDDENFISDVRAVEERIAAYSGGEYLFRPAELKLEDSTASAVEAWIPIDCLGNEPADSEIKCYINRPMELSFGDRQGSVSGYFNDEDVVELDRSDIESAEIRHGCPENVKLLDYGMDNESCYYIEFRFAEEFLNANPQIKDWKNPSIVQDFGGYSTFYSIPLVADWENNCFYFIDMNPDSTGKKGSIAAIAYNYSHPPLKEAFYFVYSSPMDWETGEEITGQNQAEPQDLEGEAELFLYEMNEVVCSEEDWQQAVKAVKARLDALELPYLFGKGLNKEHTIAVKIRQVPYIDDLMEIIMTSPGVRLQACSTYESVLSSDIQYSFSQKDGSCTLSMDMSETGKDTLNELSDLCCRTGDGRIWMSAGYKPVLWADVDSVISDGKITFTGNALSGDTKFSDDDLRLFNVIKAILTGEPFPLKGNPPYMSSKITLVLRESTILNENGSLAVGYYHRFDRDRAVETAAEKIRDLETTAVRQDDSGRIYITMPMPDEKERLKIMTEQTREILKRIKNDARVVGGVTLEWAVDDDNRLQLICGNNEYPDRGRFSLYFYFSGIIDESYRDEFIKTMAQDDYLAKNLKLTDR